MPKPDYNQNEEGFITVEIKVDANGNVTDASIKRANITSATLRSEALSAARRTKFTSGTGVQVGTITYNFKLR
jgi:TonB family protein